MKTLRRYRASLGGFMTALVAIWQIVSPMNLSADPGDWISNGDGNWTDTTKWDIGYVPNGIGEIAYFRNDITANRTVTLDAPITLGGLIIGDALGTSGFIFTGTNALTFDNGGSGAFLNKYSSATNTWRAPLILDDALSANIYAGTLEVNGVSNAQVSYSGAGDTIKNGAGALNLNIDAATTPYTGDWVMNFGTLNIGGLNNAAPTSLGTGTGGITLNGSGRSDLTVLGLRNNGTAVSDTDIVYSGNNDVILQGGARINVDRNYIAPGANTGNTIVLDNLTMNGGILSVTGSNSYRLRFDGTTTLVGDTNVFSIEANTTQNYANLTLAGAITDGANTRALIKEGPGRMIVSNAANTYDGVTAIKDGVLQVGAGANLGSGAVYVNGGAIGLTSAAQATTTTNATFAGGLNLVSQIGTTRNSLGAIVNTGFTIDGANQLAVNVPIYGMALEVDNIANSIDLSQVGGAGNTRVYLGNRLGFNNTYAGNITAASDNNIRLTSGNSLILATDDQLGTVGGENLIIGVEQANPLQFAGLGITHGTGGTVSVQGNNSFLNLGTVTVNRGVTLNISGAGVNFGPVGFGVVTSLGGNITTDNTSDAQFGNTDFRLYGGATLLLDNSNVTGGIPNVDRRLTAATDIDLTSSTLRLIGDGGAAGNDSSQAVNSIDYAGGSTLSVDRDGIVGSVTTLTAGALNRTNRGTLNIRSISNNATTFGTASGTQKLIITTAPTVTNDMIGANIALWGGTTSNDQSQPLFATYDATDGVQAAAFTLSGAAVDTAAELNGAATSAIVSIDALTANMAVTTASVQALRIRTTANTNQSVNTGTITIGSTAAAGQGAGLYLAHTANNTITHSANFAFGTQEGLIYAATSGGTAGVIELNGVLSGSNGVTRFGNGILRLSGSNTFTGPITINSGETRFNNAQAGGVFTNPANMIDMWGGSLYFEAGNQRYNNNITFNNDARLGNVNVGGTGFNNLTVAARTGSTAPVIALILNQGGGNVTTAFGGLTLNGPAQFYVAHPFQVNGALSGTGTLEKFGNERLFIGGDSSAYTQAVTVNTGTLSSINSLSTAKPFGTGAITVNPGGALRLAAPTNINGGQVTLNSDLGGISGIGMTYVGDPAALPAFTSNTTAPWRAVLGVGAVGFSQNINQSTLWGGDVYLGALLGDTGIYTGTLTPAAGNNFLLGTGQGVIRIASPLTGASNNAVIGLSMTGDVGRANQAVNNSGGVVQYDVPMTYGGSTTVNLNTVLRISATNAVTGIGDITLNGGVLQGDSNVGQVRLLAPLTIANTINLTADSGIQMQNQASDFHITGTLNLASGSTGVVRQLFVGVDQPGAAQNNAGNLYLDGGISDGVGGSGNHFIKHGAGTLMLTGTQTYTGSTTVSGGILGINGDADLASSSQIILAGGGIGVYENSFVTSRNYSVHGGNGWFDVAAGLTLTQAATSTIDGSNFLMKRGLGTMLLNGTNAQTGIYLADGTLQVNTQASLGDPATTTAIQFGNDQTLGGANNGTRYTGGTLRINFTGATNRGLTFNNNAAANYSGGVDVTAGNTFTVNGAMTQGTENDFGFKTGLGTLITTGTNTGRQYAFTNGTFQFGNSTPWSNSTATVADITNIEFLGGTVRAVNTGANIALANAASTTNYNYGGGGHIRMESGGGFSVEFAGDNLVRVNQGTLVIETAGGTLLGGVGNTDAARLLTTNAINSGVARASAVNNGIFAAHLIGADSAGTAFFLQNNVTTGFEAYSGATSATLTGIAPTAIGDITVAQVLSGANSIYAFRTTANVSGGTLRIGAIDNLRDGGILINGSNTISSNLIFDPTSSTAPGTGTVGEGLVYVKTGEDATLSGTVMSNAFTKFGDGNLNLTGSTTVLSELSVQSGTLKLGPGGLTSRMNSELNINAGATLDLNGSKISVETLGSNNRQVATTNIGGQITNSSITQATLAIAGPITSTFNGTLDLNLKLVKAGAGVLTINGFSASTPDGGNNTYTGGTDIYGVNLVGGINLNNTTFGLGGYNGSTPGDVNLYSGTLGLLNSNGTTAVNGTQGQLFSNQVVKIGSETGNGITVNVKGPSQINVNQSVNFGQGNIMQIGALNMTNNTLNLSGGNLYRLRVAGTTTILGAQATFQTNNDGPSGALEFTGLVTGAGAINKTGDGGMRTIVFSNSANNYSGGTNIIGGDVQVTTTSGSALGTGMIRVFPDGTLRIAGNGSINGANLQVMSRVNALGAVALDDNFNPTVLNSTNFSSVYNTTLQLAQPYWTQALDMAAIGDGRAFLGSGLNIESKYLGTTLGAGVADDWNPGVGVYRIVGGVNNLAFEGANNVFTGTSYMQVGPRRNMVLGAATNTGNAVFIRNSNDYSGGTQIAEGTVLISEVGGSPIGETALGTGAVEVYGEYRIQGQLGSAWKADANAGLGGATNTVNLRPGGTVRVIGASGEFTAGDQGKWGDAVGIDLNGGQFRYDGGANWTGVETIGDVTARKGGILSVFRNSTSSSAQLNVGNIDRIDHGTVTINYNNGFLGTNLTTPLSYERLTATQIDGTSTVTPSSVLSGTTNNGTGVSYGGIVAPWIIDQVTNSFVGYDPTGAGTGFQPLISSATPGAGEIAYSKRATTGGANIAFPATAIGDTVDLAQVGFNGTASITLAAGGQSLHALRIMQTSGTNNNSTLNINVTNAGDAITIASGGLILGNINSSGGSTYTLNVNPNLVFGSIGTPVEALLYVAANGANTSVTNINGQITAAGLTKFGSGTVQINSINPGISSAVTINAGTMVVRVPFSGSGAAVGQTLNSQDVILNGGALVLDGFLANAAGTATEIASNVRATALFNSNIFVRGDATLGNNGTGNYVRIQDLTFENGGGAAAMNGNGVINLVLQSGLWVDGTTTLNEQAVFNSTFNGFAQSTLAGQVTGTGDLEKYGNGTMTLLNGTNNYSGGTLINGTTNNTAVSTVASGFRGAGTPFGTGTITVNPGGLLRIADNLNIANNVVNLKSDGYGLAGLGIAHNGALPTITTGVALPGQVHIESTGPFAGVITLDYGYYDKALNMAAIPGGSWFLGNSQQAETYYFNSTLGAAANGKYLLGGGGNQSGINFGAVLVSGARTNLFENIFSGGTANTVRIEVGALTNDLFANGPSMVNGNAGFVTLATRNTGLVGDVRSNTNSTLAIGNNFALGDGRLIMNGGNLRYDIATNNFLTNSITLDNNVLLQGDWSTSSGNELVLNGNVSMHDGAAGATRIWNLTGSGAMAIGLTAGSATNGVISGNDGSNLIKRGAQLVSFRGENSYQGFTQIDRGTIVVTGDVLAGVNGPLGNSTSAIILGVESTNNAGSLGIGGKYTIGRDILVTGAAGTGVNLIEGRTNETARVTGSISIVSGGVLTVGAASADVAGFRGGILDIQGSISGAGAVVIGTTGTAPNNGGTVTFSASSNGYGTNTYAGGTTLQSARLQIASDTYFSGPVTAPTILSGPLGTGTFTFGAGEANRGGTIEAVGGARTIVNALGANATAANTTVSFSGHEALTFTRDYNINSDATLRNRVFTLNNRYQAVTFSGNLSNSGVQGSNFLKTGNGMLILTGTNTQANLLTTDVNYGTGVFIDAGILRVGADASLGSLAALPAAGSHLLGPADVRLRGGVLSISSGFTTARQFILTNNNSGIDVANGQTLALSTQTAGAFNITKTGNGTLALNNSANTITNLTLGGVQQLNPNSGRYSHTGGTVSTTMTGGTPFGTTSVTINSGTLSLIGGGVAQALAIPTINYGAAGHIALSAGATSSQLTASTAFNRQGAFNGVNYGTLTINPSSLANLGGTEKLLVTAGAPANTVGTGGNILTVPSVFAALAGSGQDANFTRYDAVNGFMEHNVTTVATLAATAPTNVADIAGADVAGAGNIDVLALRTSANITPTDGTSLIRIAGGGLIINGATASTLSSNVLFGTGAGAGLTEAIVYVRDGQTGTSAISGNITARDFTKTGPGALEISGATNFLNSNATRLPVLSIQNGTLRFANSGAAFQNQLRGTTVGNNIGHFALNVNESGIFDLNGLNLSLGGLTGNGTVTSNVAGATTLTVKNGFGVNTTFSGSITNGIGTVSLTKTQNGIMTLSGHNTYSGGTTVQAGRVTNAVGSTSGLGRLEAQTMTALGTGPVTLAGGTLTLNAATLLNSAQTMSEAVDGFEHNLWGGPNGLDLIVSSTAFTNGVALPANVTSTFNAATQNAGINSLTINAPILTTTAGILQVNGATTINQDTVIRTAGGRLFLAGQLNAAGQTLTKTGASDLVLTNTESGAGQNSVGLWKVYGGLLDARSADGASNPLGANAVVEINGGTTGYGLLLSTDGDGTFGTERVTTYADTTVRFGSALSVSSNEFVMSSNGRLKVDRILANNDDKTVVIGALEIRGALGSPSTLFTNGNGANTWVEGTTNFQRDWNIEINPGVNTGLTLNGVISGNGSINRRGYSGSMFFNAVNTYTGGTFFVTGGRNILGSLEGNQITLSNTAKLGMGHVFLGPLSTFQINDAGNLRADQNIYVGGNLSYAATFSLAADLTLDQVRLRSAGLGGIQNSATDYYLNATNPSSAVLALGTVYNQTIDMGALGDGMWFLGSATNMVGANGSYDAATLGAGLGNTYRLGAGGGTLFFGSNGNANILSDNNVTGAVNNLVVGAPMTLQNASAWSGGNGTVVLLGSQNYTGSTLINRSSTLDFRGTLATSSIETYGGLNVAGEAGTFIGAGPVTLRPGSILRFDNTSAGVLPVASLEGRWADATGIALDNSTVRMQGNAAVETSETVGAITTKGGSFIEIVRGVIGRGTELRAASISRVGNGTIQLGHNGGQLGTNERLIVTGAAPIVTNGMVGPWMVSNTDVQFVTYNNDTGFTDAGFDRVQAVATLAATVTATANRTLFSGNVVLNSGVDFETYALRLDGNVTLGTAADTNAQLIIGSGGLISNGTRTITSGIVAGSIATPAELLLYNNGTTTIGSAANFGTSGQIVATGITKFGAGSLVLTSNNTAFTGDIRIQQGNLQLNYSQTSVANPTTVSIGGNGGNIIFEGSGTVLDIRGGNDLFTGDNLTFTKSLVLGDYVPIATVTVDRSGGTIANKTMVFNNLTFGLSNNDVGQIFRVDGRNGFDLRFTGTTTLNGRSAFMVDNSYTGSASDLFLDGQVTGTGTLIKGPSDGRGRELNLRNVTTLNDWTSGTVLQGGTLRIFAKAVNSNTALATVNMTAGGVGSGDITLMQGLLDLRVDADAGDQAGTYTATATTVTVTKNGHGYANGNTITVTSGPAAGTYTVANVAANTFTFALAGPVVGAATPLTFVGADAQLERVVYEGGSATMGPNVLVNGSSQINLDRTGLVTAGSTGAQGSNKQVVLGNLTMGSQWLTVTSGNGYSLEFGGTTTLLGNATLNNTTDLVLNGAISTDGGGVILNKINTGVLWINSANPTLAANTYINAGLLDFGNRLTGSTTANLGIGDIYVNAGASARIRGTGNLNTGLGQQFVLTSTAYSSALLRTVGAFTQAQLASFIQPRTTTSNEVTYISFEGAPGANNLDQSTLGDGRIYFGAIGDRTYTGAALGSSLTPGLANFADSVVGGTSANRVYRLGHNSGNTLTINLTAAGAGLGDVGGATDVQIGSLATLGTSNFNTGYVYFQDQNTYTGQTVVSRGLTLRFNQSMNVGDTAGPLGANGGALVDIYGTLRTEAGGSLRNNLGSANFYTNINLHPGSNLLFMDMDDTGPNSNRWDDTTGINLDGSILQGEALANGDNNAETVGAITFDRGSRIFLSTEGTGDVILTAASITRAASGPGAGTGRGTMVFTPTATAVFGAAATAGVAQTQMKFTSVPTASATSAVFGMLPGYYIDGNGHRFVKNGANGITPVVDGDMVAMPTGAGAGTEVVNITGTTTMGSFETSIFALRGGAFTLNSATGANNDSTITLGGSGADVGAVASFGAFVINPNLKFGATGTNEALFYAGGGIITLNGNLTAGSVTKFGTNQLVIANDQSDAARGTGQGYQGGWVVNEGSLTLNTFGSAGNAHVNNTIVLNGNQQTNPTLYLRANPADTLLNYTYTSGKIFAVDNATIDFDPGVDDRVHTIADIEIQQSGGIGNAPANGTVDAQLRVANNRNRSILAAGTLTVSSNAILNVDTTASVANNVGGSTNGAYLTNSISSGMSVASLVGSNRLTKWGDGTLYVRGDSSGTFSGNMVIDQGAVFVTNNGSLGTGALTVNRYGVLEIGVANFSATNSSVTYNEGSIERWSIANARSGALNLGKATLQVADDQITTSVAITLNGGGIQAYQRGDDLSGAQFSGGVLRTLGTNVTFTLAGDSFLGNRYYEGANGLDGGKQTNDNRPMEEILASGAILDVKGVISGTGGLTKVGYDTVILSGQNTYAGATVVAGGKLMVGTNDALTTTTTLTTTSNGVLDLNGNNQTVGKLANVVAGTGMNSTSGFITNSATSVKTLTVGNGVNGPANDFTYGGVIQHNVALTKIGTSMLTLTNVNTYTGATIVNTGSLKLTHATGAVLDAIAGTSSLTMANGTELHLRTGTGGGTMTLSGASGTVLTFGGNNILAVEVGGTGGTGISVNAGAQAFVSGTVTVDVYGTNTGAVIPSTVISAPTGGLMNTNGSTGNYVLGTVYNNTDFTVTGLTQTDTLVQLNTAVVTALTAAYWTGGLSGGASDVWSTSVGANSNWSSDAAGTIDTGVVPGAGADVFISATSNVNQNNMLLGADMTIKSLTINAANTVSPVVLQSTGGYTLTIAGAAAITTDVTSSAATIDSKLAFSAPVATIAVNSANPLTINGAISGTALTKTGTGTLVLGGANTYTGPTLIQEGTLQAAATNTLPVTGDLNFSSSTATAPGTTVGTLDLSTNGVTVNNLNVYSDSVSNNVISIGAGQVLQVNGAVTVGANSTTVNTTTKLTMSGAGTFQIGTLATPTNANVKVDGNLTNNRGNAATLDMLALETFYANLGSGTFFVGDTADASLGANTNSTLLFAKNSTVTANAYNQDGQHGSTLVELGSGTNVFNVNTLTVGGNNRGVGTFGFDGLDLTGTLQVRALDTVSRAAMNVASGAAGTGLNLVDTVDLTGHTADLLLSNLNIGGRSGGVTGSSTGTFLFGTGVLDATTINLAARTGTSLTTGNVTGTLTLGGGTSTVGTLIMSTNSSSVSTTGDATSTFNISGGTHTIGTLTMGVNTVSGATATASNTDATINVTGGTTTVNTAFSMGAQNSASNAATNVNSAISTLNISAGTLTLSGSTNLTMGQTTLDAQNAATASIDITGTGSLTVGGNIAYTDGLGTETNTVTLNGGTLDMTNGSIGAGAALITLNAQSGTLRNLAELNGGATLTKTTAGTLILEGTNSYTGATTVSAGTLQVGNGGSGTTGTGAFTTQGGSTVTGTGLVQGSSATFVNLSTLRPGDGPADSNHGTLTFTPAAAGSVTFDAGSAVVLGISTATTNDGNFGGNTIGSAGYDTWVNGIIGVGSHDRLVFNGDASNTLTLNGNLSVVSSGYTAQFGDAFNLLDWATLMTADFTGFTLGTNFRDGSADDLDQFNLADISGTGLVWDISNFTTSGVIVVVPEPSRVLLLMFGLMALFFRRRRAAVV